MTARSWPREFLIVVLVLSPAAAACSAAEGEAGVTDSTNSSVGPAEDTTTTRPMPSSTTSSVTTMPPLVVVPSVIGPVTGGNGPILPQPATALPGGYVEEEFFIGGEATRLEAVGATDGDGFWTARPADTADYRTRVLVRRPPPDRFSGIVVVEWLNVTAIEASPDWGYLLEEIADAGHAYVAVSVQALGVVGGESLLAVEIDEEVAAEAGAETEVLAGGLVNLDPERYGTLVHPGDQYAYDIFGQVGHAVAQSIEGLLGGLEPSLVIAAGESQSAGFLTTYVNAIHPQASVFDGFFIHSRGAGAAPLGGGFGVATGEDDGPSFVSEGVRIRTDLSEPVFMLQSETDLTLLGYTLARQDDTDLIRTWEVAGTAHADAHVFRSILGGPRNPASGSLLGCERLINAGPHHEAAQAALHHLVVWAEGGPPPPTGERIEIVDGDPVAIARDELGRARGGVRNPLVDVPVAIYSGDPYDGVSLDGSDGFDICDLFGQTALLDATTLVDLHGSADEYVAAFAAATDAAVEDGFLLPIDAVQLLEEAEANRALFG